MDSNSVKKCLLESIYWKHCVGHVGCGACPNLTTGMGFRLRLWLTLARSLHQIKYSKQRYYKCAYFLLFCLLFTLWIYRFHCYSMSFIPLCLCCHINSLHCQPDSPHFWHFNPDSPHSQADSPHTHSHLIPHISTLILHMSLIPFPSSSFWILQIVCPVCNL